MGRKRRCHILSPEAVSSHIRKAEEEAAAKRSRSLFVPASIVGTTGGMKAFMRAPDTDDLARIGAPPPPGRLSTEAYLHTLRGCSIANDLFGCVLALDAIQEQSGSSEAWKAIFSTVLQTKSAGVASLPILTALLRLQDTHDSARSVKARTTLLYTAGYLLAAGVSDPKVVDTYIEVLSGDVPTESTMKYSSSSPFSEDSTPLTSASSKNHPRERKCDDQDTGTMLEFAAEWDKWIDEYRLHHQNVLSQARRDAEGVDDRSRATLLNTSIHGPAGISLRADLDIMIGNVCEEWLSVNMGNAITGGRQPLRSGIVHGSRRIKKNKGRGGGQDVPWTKAKVLAMGDLLAEDSFRRKEVEDARTQKRMETQSKRLVDMDRLVRGGEKKRKEARGNTHEDEDEEEDAKYSGKEEDGIDLPAGCHRPSPLVEPFYALSSTREGRHSHRESKGKVQSGSHCTVARKKGASATGVDGKVYMYDDSVDHQDSMWTRLDDARRIGTPLPLLMRRFCLMVWSRMIGVNKSVSIDADVQARRLGPEDGTTHTERMSRLDTAILGVALAVADVDRLAAYKFSSNTGNARTGEGAGASSCRAGNGHTGSIRRRTMRKMVMNGFEAVDSVAGTHGRSTVTPFELEIESLYGVNISELERMDTREWTDGKERDRSVRMAYVIVHGAQGNIRAVHTNQGRPSFSAWTFLAHACSSNPISLAHIATLAEMDARGLLDPRSLATALFSGAVACSDPFHMMFVRTDPGATVYERVCLSEDVAEFSSSLIHAVDGIRNLFCGHKPTLSVPRWALACDTYEACKEFKESRDLATSSRLSRFVESFVTNNQPTMYVDPLLSVRSETILRKFNGGGELEEEDEKGDGSGDGEAGRQPDGMSDHAHPNPYRLPWDVIPISHDESIASRIFGIRMVLYASTIAAHNSEDATLVLRHGSLDGMAASWQACSFRDSRDVFQSDYPSLHGDPTKAKVFGVMRTRGGFLSQPADHVYPKSDFYRRNPRFAKFAGNNTSGANAESDPATTKAEPPSGGYTLSGFDRTNTEGDKEKLANRMQGVVKKRLGGDQKEGEKETLERRVHRTHAKRASRSVRKRRVPSKEGGEANEKEEDRGNRSPEHGNKSRRTKRPLPNPTQCTASTGTLVEVVSREAAAERVQMHKRSNGVSKLLGLRLDCFTRLDPIIQRTLRANIKNMLLRSQLPQPSDDEFTPNARREVHTLTAMTKSKLRKVISAMGYTLRNGPVHVGDDGVFYTQLGAGRRVGAGSNLLFRLAGFEDITVEGIEVQVRGKSKKRMIPITPKGIDIPVTGDILVRELCIPKGNLPDFRVLDMHSERDHIEDDDIQLDAELDTRLYQTAFLNLAVLGILSPDEARTVCGEEMVASSNILEFEVEATTSMESIVPRYLRRGRSTRGKGRDAEGGSEHGEEEAQGDGDNDASVWESQKIHVYIPFVHKAIVNTAVLKEPGEYRAVNTLSFLKSLGLPRRLYPIGERPDDAKTDPWSEIIRSVIHRIEAKLVRVNTDILLQAVGIKEKSDFSVLRIILDRIAQLCRTSCTMPTNLL